MGTRVSRLARLLAPLNVLYHGRPLARLLRKISISFETEKAKSHFSSKTSFNAEYDQHLPLINFSGFFFLASSRPASEFWSLPSWVMKQNKFRWVQTWPLPTMVNVVESIFEEESRKFQILTKIRKLSEKFLLWWKCYCWFNQQSVPMSWRCSNKIFYAGRRSRTKAIRSFWVRLPAG